MPATKKTPVSSTEERMAALFVSNDRSSGRFDPGRGRMHTEYTGLSAKEFGPHLSGSVGCGGVPILDDDTCMWAAIDIDAHDSDEDIPIHPVDELIRQHKLPLIACRSKSGGIHCYMFMEKPIAASKIRSLLGRWSEVVGYKGHEIFPKQARLGSGEGGEGKKSLGNWINLPYFGGDDTNRYAVREGKKLKLLEFLTLAEKLRVDESDLKTHAVADHPNAPPCVQRMFTEGVGQGQRNEALYNTVIYLKKMDPDGYEGRAKEANSAMFTKPLGRAEMQRTIGSAARPGYSYRCNEEPIRSLCDRATCLKREFGITPDEADRLQATESLPLFNNLVKYLTEPIRWQIDIDGQPVTNISTQQLLEWRFMRELIAERLTKIVPVIKPNEWERLLQPLMAEARIVETPDEASVTGVVRDRLREFASKTDLSSKGDNMEDRKSLMRGMPVVAKVQGERCVVFRAQDYINYLKRTKSEELKGVNLWFALKGMGVISCKLRVGESTINVWHVPVRSILSHSVEPMEFKSDL